MTKQLWKGIQSKMQMEYNLLLSVNEIDQDNE